ncbi:hypothetical protein SBA6_160024 [Candidatus Sulfopaludibacter sp. SbA6]|nr:hypothetical protein SBA6_160024 [Candidatus Sulfopaludibacter sp. SbA6]
MASRKNPAAVRKIRIEEANLLITDVHPSGTSGTSGTLTLTF